MTSWHPGETKEQASERYAWHMAYEQLVKDEGVVRAENGCWIWQGLKNPNDYGIITYGSRSYLAVKVAWEAWYGSLPEGQFTHRCCMPECVNPRHIYWNGEEFTSLQRAYIKGSLTSRNALKLAREFGTTAATIRKIAAENL